MKSFVVFVSSLFAASMLFAQTPASAGLHYYKGDIKAMEAAASHDRKPYIILATAGGCGNTLATEKACAQDPNFSAYAEKAFYIKKVNVMPASGDTDGMIVMQNYGIRATPAILMFLPSGKLMKRLEGAQTPSSLTEAMDEVIKAESFGNAPQAPRGMEVLDNQPEPILPDVFVEIHPNRVDADDEPMIAISQPAPAKLMIAPHKTVSYAKYSATNAPDSVQYTIRIGEYPTQEALDALIEKLPTFWGDSNFEFHGIWVRVAQNQHGYVLGIGSFADQETAEYFVKAMHKNLPSVAADIVPMKNMR